MVLLYLVVMTSAPALLNTVLEEKMQKISEVLLASVSPFELMLGKLLGTVLVSLTLSALYMGSVMWGLWRFGQLGNVPGHLFAWFFVFQVLALLMFGSVFLAIGAACNEIRDAQSLMMPVMMVVMVPYLMFMPVLQSPASPFSRAVSLFPPATPMLMFLRLAVPPGPAWWEVALGVGLTTAFMLGCVWASAKIFRIGILSQGQAPSLPKMIRWVFSK
jgi:ABC-2 type transport system permease protein